MHIKISLHTQTSIQKMWKSVLIMGKNHMLLNSSTSDYHLYPFSTLERAAQGKSFLMRKLGLSDFFPRKTKPGYCSSTKGLFPWEALWVMKQHVWAATGHSPGEGSLLCLLCHPPHSSRWQRPGQFHPAPALLPQNNTSGARWRL